MHQPVLLKEVLEFLAPRAGGVYMDGSLGTGGYAEAILEAASPDGILLGFDIDEDSIHQTTKRLEHYGKRFRCWHAGYHEAFLTLDSMGIGQLNGIVLDLGLSSDQLENPNRGFSFRFSGPLDMRFNRSIGESAEDLLKSASESKLQRIISEYGEERRAKKIAQRLKQGVSKGTLKTTGDLADVVLRALGGKKGRIHPATRVFQALRIAVNDELGKLKKGLEQLPNLLKQHGRLCVVSYHSLEDRMVKLAFKELARDKSKWRILTPRPLRSSSEERISNPRSRSAKMRVIELL
ncbi:MAG: 16S rRNA (cytosine(1402)-N(4))-methyltransferase RsmH [Pseudomonadota bacterium]